MEKWIARIDRSVISGGEDGCLSCLIKSLKFGQDGEVDGQHGGKLYSMEIGIMLLVILIRHYW